VTTASHAQETSKRTAVFNQQWLKGIVSIEIHDAQGKGTPIGSGFLLLTPNKHIATDGKSILFPDTVVTARLKSGWFRSETTDVACRLIVREDISDFVTIPYSLFLPTRQMESGAPLFIIGFPLGLRSDQYATPIVRRASIARVDQDMLIVDGVVYPGNSGGPVIYEPALQLGTGFTTPILQGDWFVGMVLSEISYVEPAISLQTKRPRVTFEQNSGLSNVLPADKILELVRVPEFVKADEALR